jgi:hypothetical protein
MLLPDIQKRLIDGSAVAAEIPCPKAECREWVGVHPFRIEFSEYPPQREIDTYPLRYRILRFRLPRLFDFHTYDLHAEYVESVSETIEASVEAVFERISTWGIKPEELTDPLMPRGS